MLAYSYLCRRIGKGEVLEWLKRHAWKACNRQNRFAGSNPVLSADSKLRGKTLELCCSLRRIQSSEVKPWSFVVLSAKVTYKGNHSRFPLFYALRQTLSMRSLTIPAGTRTTTVSPAFLLSSAWAMGDLMEILPSRRLASWGLTMV